MYDNSEKIRPVKKKKMSFAQNGASFGGWGRRANVAALTITAVAGEYRCKSAASQ